MAQAEVIRMALTMEECEEGKKQIAEYRDFVKRVKDEDLYIETIEGYVRTKASGMIKDEDAIARLDQARIADRLLFNAIWTAMCESISASIVELGEQYDKLEAEIDRRERMEANEDQ